MSTFTSRVVGCGSIGSRYIRVLAEMSGIKPLAVPVSGYLRDEELRDFCVIEENPSEESVVTDLTVIASSTLRHPQDAVRYRPLADKMLVEKPLAASVSHWTSVTAQMGSVENLWTAAPLRMLDGYSEVSSRLSSLGRVRSVAIECRSWLGNWRPARNVSEQYSSDASQGGVLRDLIHEFDYALKLFGSPEQVSCVTRSGPRDGIGSDAQANVTWIYPGFLMTFGLDYLSQPAIRRMHVSGRDGSLIWNIAEGNVCSWLRDGRQAGNSYYLSDLDRDSVLKRELNAVLSGAPKNDPNTSVNDGLRALHAVDLAHSSAEEHGLAIAWSVNEDV